MTQETLSMTYKEIDRVTLIRQCLEKKIKQNQAAQVLGLSYRQFKRLIKRYRQEGSIGVISKSRGKASNKRYPQELKHQTLSIIKQEFYDYGPTLAAEKLDEYHKIKISKETARQWMIEAHIWRPYEKPIPKLHPCRERRDSIGELLQIDGSEHYWFEERGPKCTLLVFIDDATSTIQKMLFCDDETTLNYFTAFKDYVLRYGAPRSLYNDKHGVFKVNHPEAKSGNGLTQFGRALESLGIEEIFAHSPQAKGRVERANGILQDRLVKALRYRGISDMASANQYIEEFRQEYNAKFAKSPKSSVDMHRALTEEEKEGLDKLFSVQVNRVISKDMLVRCEGTIYRINEPNEVHRLRQARVLVCENVERKISIYHQDKPLNFEVYRKNLHVAQILNRAKTNNYLDRSLKLEKHWLPNKNMNSTKNKSAA